MTQLNYIREELEKLKSEIFSCSYDKNDMRKSFLGLTYDVLNNYYHGMSFLKLSELINTGVLFPESIKPFKQHLDRIADVGNSDIWTESFRNNNKRNIIIDSWSNFEFAILIICEYVLNEKEKQSLLVNPKLINNMLKNV